MKKTFVVFVLFIYAQLLFGQDKYIPDYTVSGLIQYGENINRERLELLEDRQVIRISGGDSRLWWSYSLTGTYVIRNSGEEYRATLGLLFDIMQSGIPSPSLTGLQFFVNGREASYTETGRVWGGIAMGETEIELPQTSTAWALIDVVFPADSTVTIQVRYNNTFSSTQMGARMFLIYNASYTFEEYFPGLQYWRGTAQFSVEVINSYFYETNVEHYWISSIGLRHKNDISKYINMATYLSEMQGLETEWFKIIKLNGNSFRVDFTEEFMRNYRRFLTIYFTTWEGGQDWGYLQFDYPTREIMREHFGKNNNISRRELAPYELIFLTNNQLRIMRNAFYAQYGYVFQSEALQNMFEEKRRNLSFSAYHESMLTEIDLANIETIRRLETMAED